MSHTVTIFTMDRFEHTHCYTASAYTEVVIYVPQYGCGHQHDPAAAETLHLHAYFGRHSRVLCYQTVHMEERHGGSNHEPHFVMTSHAILYACSPCPGGSYWPLPLEASSLFVCVHSQQLFPEEQTEHSA